MLNQRRAPIHPHTCRSGRLTRLIGLVILGWAMTTSAPSLAGTAEVTAPPLAAPARVKKEGFEPRYFVGGKGSYLVAIHKGADALGHSHTEASHHGGGGVFVEFTLLRHWLELEVCFRGLSASHGAVLPLDLLFKIPFHLNRWFHPYVGLGAVMAVAVDHGHTAVHFGGASAVGAYFWIAPRIALLAELDFNLLEEHGLVPEVGFNAGVVLGF